MNSIGHAPCSASSEQIVGSNGILECKSLPENAHRATTSDTVLACQLVAREGWLIEREEHRATTPDTVLACQLVAREGWLIEKEEHRATQIVTCSISFNTCLVCAKESLVLLLPPTPADDAFSVWTEFTVW
jgi:hypothetical protein